MANSLSVDRAMKQAKALAAKGQIGEARGVLEQLLARFPKNKRAAEALRALPVDPRQAAQARIQSALQGLIQLFNQGKLDQVITQAEEMAKSLPKLPILPNMIGAAMAAKGDYDGAVAQYERALELDPKLVPAHNNLGAAKAELSLFDEAVAHYQEALRLDPSYAQAENNLGNALRQLGETEDAVTHYRQAIQLNDKLADAHGNLATCLAALGEVEEALACLDQAVALDPAKAEFQASRAAMLNALGRFDAALDSYEALIARDPRPEYLNNRANVLAALDRTEAAVEAFREVLAANPELVEAWSNLCGLYEKTNRIAELRTTLDAATEAVGAWDAQIRFWSGVLAAREGDDVMACEYMEAVLPDELPAPYQALQAATLGRAQDRLGRTAEAFEQFGRMNQLTADRAGHTVNPLSYMDEIAAVKVSLETAVDWPEGSEGADLVFMVGMPRSGTTLLDTILRGHPQIEVVEEGPMVQAAQNLLPGPATVETLSALDDAQLDAMRAAYRAALAARADKPGASLTVDKLPLNIVHVPLIRRLFPGARFLLVLRHPCDAVLSCFMQNFRLNDAMANFLDLEDTAALYDLAMGIWVESGERLQPQVSQIRYEDLVEDLEGTVRPLLADLGLDWTDAMADFQETARARGRINTPSYAQVSQGLYTSAKGRWEGYRFQMEPVIEVLTPWAERWGYEI